MFLCFYVSRKQACGQGLNAEAGGKIKDQVLLLFSAQKRGARPGRATT